MITLGVILAIIGVLVGIPVLTTIGLILVAVGAALWLLGSLGRPIGRSHYW